MRPSASRPRPSPTAFPVATDVRLGGDDKQTRLVVDFEPEGRSRRLHARRPLPRGDRPAAGRLQAAAQGRRAGARPGQGVPLRPDHAGRLAHRARHQGSGAGGQGLHARRRRRPAGAAGHRLERHRPRKLPAQHFAGQPHQRSAAIKQTEAAPADERRSAPAHRHRSRPRRHRQRHQIVRAGRTRKTSCSPSA